MFDVVVVGAGPSGCRTAELIAKKGFKVLVLEEDEKIGEPVRCAGLVSWRIKEMLPELPESLIVNRVRKARFYSSEKNFLELKSKKPVYVLNREKLDKFLARKAREAGARIKTSVKFQKFKREKDRVEIMSSRGKFKSKLLIGADGVNSRVAREAGIERVKNYLPALQASVRGNFESDHVELWFNASPDFFGWLIPESKRKARIGIASKQKCSYYFKKFLKRRIKRIVNPNVSGIINFGLMKESVAERILLVGDAACQIKPFSGGGIIYGLIGAGFAALASIKALRKNDFSYDFLKENYDEAWKEKLKWPIRKGLILKKLVHYFCNDFTFSFIKAVGLTKTLESFDVDLL